MCRSSSIQFQGLCQEIQSLSTREWTLSQDNDLRIIVNGIDYCLILRRINLFITITTVNFRRKIKNKALQEDLGFVVTENFIFTVVSGLTDQRVDLVGI